MMTTCKSVSRGNPHVRFGERGSVPCRRAMLVAVLSAVCLGGSALATDITFPANVTSGDLTDPAVLPLDKRPTASDRLTFTSSPKDLTVSNTNEFMLGGLVFNTEHGSYKITVADDTTVKLPYSGSAVQMSSRWMSTLFKGGTWNFGGTGSYYCNGGWNVGHYCTNVIDGASMTNINLFVVSDYNTGISLVLTNGAHVTAKEVWFSRDGTNKRRRIVIAGGSTLTAKNTFWGATENDENSLTLVTGAGSCLTLPTGTGYYGSCGGINIGLRVENGGEIKTRAAQYFDYSKTSDGNYIEVGNGGTFKGGGTLTLGSSTTSTNFEFRVLEGGVADLGLKAIEMLYNVSVIVSNGTLSTGGVVPAGGRNSRLRLIGPQTTFTWNKKETSLYYFFKGGKNNAIELDDHAVWEPGVGFTWTHVNAQTNRLSLANGAKMTVPAIQFAYTTGGGSTHGNRIDVLSGSTLTLTDQDFACGNDNVITVSNATMHVLQFNLGQGSGERDRIVVKGTTPRFYSDGYLYLSGTDPTLEFDLSDGPLALEEGKAPIQVGGTFYVISSSMNFKVTGIESLTKKLTSKKTMPLFKYAQEWDSTTVARLDAALAAENAVLEAEFGEKRHVLSRTGRTVYLTSKPRPRGLVVIFR